MRFAVADFHAWIRLLEEHPNWQAELRRLLFLQDLLDLPRTVGTWPLPNAVEETLTCLTERVEQGFAEVVAEQQDMRWDIGQLKGLK